MTPGKTLRFPTTVATALVATAALLPGAVDAQVQAAETTPHVARLDSMDARAQGCVTCHGQQGQGSANDTFPRIAGKPAGYLYNQLAAFRDGTRRYAPMNYLVAYLPDDYLHEMARYFAAQRPAFPPPAPVPQPPLAQRGAQLASQGDPARGIPACMACHGRGLTGMEPGIPGLVGLRPAYIAGQLTRWRVGERHAAAPDCMKRIADRLTEQDIGALAAWLGAQAPPANAEPEPSNLVRMPFACGSQRSAP